MNYLWYLDICDHCLLLWGDQDFYNLVLMLDLKINIQIVKIGNFTSATWNCRSSLEHRVRSLTFNHLWLLRMNGLYFLQQLNFYNVGSVLIVEKEPRAQGEVLQPFIVYVKWLWNGSLWLTMRSCFQVSFKGVMKGASGSWWGLFIASAIFMY